jgi:hypothetical protein
MPAIVAPKSQGSPSKKLSPDSYVARCYQMIELGTHTENDFNGNPTTKYKIWLGWEFPTELDTFSEEKGEQPYTMGKEFPFSMHEKANLRKALESWRGAQFTAEEAGKFDLTALLGAPCSINVVAFLRKDGSPSVKIDGINRLLKGTVCPPPINTPQVFSLSEPDDAVLASLPSFLQDKIKSSQEFINRLNAAPTFKPQHSGGSDFEDAPIGEDEPLPF